MSIVSSLISPTRSPDHPQTAHYSGSPCIGFSSPLLKSAALRLSIVALAWAGRARRVQTTGGRVAEGRGLIVYDTAPPDDHLSIPRQFEVRRPPLPPNGRRAPQGRPMGSAPGGTRGDKWTADWSNVQSSDSSSSSSQQTRADLQRHNSHTYCLKWPQ